MRHVFGQWTVFLFLSGLGEIGKAAMCYTHYHCTPQPGAMRAESNAFECKSLRFLAHSKLI